MKDLLRFFHNLSSEARRSLYLAILATTILSLLEAGAIGLVYPALIRGLGFAGSGALGASEVNNISAKTTGEEILILTLLLILLILGSGARVAIYKITTSIGANIASSQSSKLFGDFLHIESGCISESDAQSLLVSLTEHVRLLAIAVIQFLQLISGIFVMVSFGILLAYFKITSGIYVFIAITVIYTGILFYTRGRIEANARQVHSLSHVNSQFIDSGIRLFREIRINSLEYCWSSKQTEAIKGERYFDAENQFLGQFPRPLIEAFIWIAMVAGVIALIITQSMDNMRQDTAQLIFTFVIGQKVVPIMQNIYFSLTSIRSGSFAISQFSRLMKKTSSNSDRVIKTGTERLESLELIDINHRYLGRKEDVFSVNVSLRIKRGMIIALSGRSGSGKSTLMDIILGLIKPQDGHILINGMPSVNRLSLAQSIAYAGQASKFMNASISENIGFSSYGSVVNQADVEEAACIACIHEVITALPAGYSTIIGDNDVNLSGGEKQRLAIARALYKKPDLLILDEATTGVDQETELLLLRNLRKKSHKMMVLICTHDRHLLDLADFVYHL